MIFAHEQVGIEWHFFFSYDSNAADEKEFVSQFTYLQPHFYIKYKGWKYNK